MAGKISDENVVLQKLLQFRNNGSYCDISVTVGDIQYPCHRVVLAAMSGYFDKLFNSEYSDNKAPNISAEEVVAVFQQVFGYIYTGNVEITLKNAYNLLVASDFLVMKELKEHCVKFIEQNPQVEDTLKIYYFATSPAGDSGFAKIAAKNVAINFARIIEMPDFLKIEHSLLESILVEWSTLSPIYECSECGEQMLEEYCVNSLCFFYTDSTGVPSAMVKEDVLLSGLTDWVKYSVVDRFQHFPKLARYTKLDEAYSNKLESLISEFTTNLTSQVDVLVKQSINFYAITENRDLAILQLNNNDDCWILCDVSKVLFYNVKDVVVGHKEYSLSSKLSENGVVNQFWVGEKQDEWSELQSTPVFGNDYVLANIGNTIYLHMYDENPIRNYKALSCVDFKEETGSRNIYSYVIDLNKWLVLPPIPKFLFHSYFISANNMLWVIGGTTSYSPDSGTKEKIIQCFDPRTSQWSERPLNVKLNYKGKACSYGDKIFICEVVMKNEQSPSSKKRNIYIYDVFLDQWETKTGEQDDAADVGALVVHDNRLWMLPSHPCSKGIVETYDLKAHSWREVSSIPSTVNWNGADYEISEILDALVC